MGSFEANFRLLILHSNFVHILIPLMIMTDQFFFFFWLNFLPEIYLNDTLCGCLQQVEEKHHFQMEKFIVFPFSSS